jgi:transcriptional regulator with XRE-family HTH domain
MRLMRGMPANSLAGLTGLSQTQIYRLERDQRPNVYAVTFVRIAQALETSVECLLGLADVPGAPK